MPYLQIDRMSPRSGRHLGENDTVYNYATKDGFHTTSTELNALATGDSFVSGYIFEGVASNGSVIVHLKTGSRVSIMTYGVGADGSCDFAVYKNPVITGNGTLFGNQSRNLVSVKESTLKTYRTPTVTSNGDIIVPRTNGGTSGPARGGSVGGDAKLLVLSPNSSYLIVATNKATTAERINIVVDWIEVDA